jgi:aminoglycoside phosphotransferase (APT) family kinase protein
MEYKAPNKENVREIVKKVFDTDTKSIARFETGYANYVYDVETSDGEKIVVRIARDDLKHFLSGALFWYPILKPIGVPLPKLLYSELDSSIHEFPVMISERLEGTDLGNIYTTLTPQSKQEIAMSIARAQQKVATLSQATGFGYAKSYDDPDLKKSWNEVVEGHVDRSKVRMNEAGIFDIEVIDELRQVLANYKPYFDGITPTAFLDDTTTKNVIVNKDSLSGIVDVDFVCFGDTLQPIGLTKMSLLSRGYTTDYTDYWMDAMSLSSEQRKMVDVYALNYCVDFMSELGQRFNRDEVAPVDESKIKSLNELFTRLKRNLV